MSRDHLAMVGTDILLSAVVKGMPVPTITWKKNGEDLPAKCIVGTTESGTKCEIPKCVRADSGDYSITVENAAGKKTATCTVLTLSMYKYILKAQATVCDVLYCA